MLLHDVALFRTQRSLQVIRQELRDLLTLHGPASVAENFAVRRCRMCRPAQVHEKPRAVPAAPGGCAPSPSRLRSRPAAPLRHSAAPEIGTGSAVRVFLPAIASWRYAVVPIP